MAGRSPGTGGAPTEREERTPTVYDHQRTTPRRGAALLRASHPGPTVTVTVIGGLLALSADLAAARAVLVVAATLTGQLSIGWSNDLVDVARDRQVHRTDKPLATGEVGVATVRAACGSALVATVPLSFACGLAAGVVQLVCVAAGWGYNLRLKSTAWSWLPYAVAFGGLPVFVTLAGDPPALPPPWVPVAGGLLGIGAHLVNALPDLADDAATGVEGLPHRIGARWAAPVATAALVLASVVICVAAGNDHRLVAAVSLLLVAALAAVALNGRGRTPFRASMAIALVDVALLAGVR